MFMMSCSCSARPVLRSNACVIEPSDSVIAVLGDSVCNVIFHAPEVKIYSVAMPEDTLDVKTEYVFRNRRSLRNNAVAELTKKANLTGSQALVNITVKSAVKTIFILNEVTFYAEATVIEFHK